MLRPTPAASILLRIPSALIIRPSTSAPMWPWASKTSVPAGILPRTHSQMPDIAPSVSASMLCSAAKLPADLTVASRTDNREMVAGARAVGYRPPPRPFGLRVGGGGRGGRRGGGRGGGGRGGGRCRRLRRFRHVGRDGLFGRLAGSVLLGGGAGGGFRRAIERGGEGGGGELRGARGGGVLLGCGAVGGFRRLIERGGEGGGGDDRGEGGTEQ